MTLDVRVSDYVEIQSHGVLVLSRRALQLGIQACYDLGGVRLKTRDLFCPYKYSEKGPFLFLENIGKKGPFLVPRKNEKKDHFW